MDIWIACETRYPSLHGRERFGVGYVEYVYLKNRVKYTNLYSIRVFAVCQDIKQVFIAEEVESSKNKPLGFQIVLKYKMKRNWNQLKLWHSFENENIVRFYSQTSSNAKKRLLSVYGTNGLWEEVDN